MGLLTSLLKADAVFALLFGLYLLALRRETFFRANRTYLLLAAVAASLLPLLTLPGGMVPMATVHLPVVVADVPVTAAERGGPSWETVLLMVYAAGVLVSLSGLALDLRRTLRALRGSSPPYGGPFTFLGRSVVPGTADPAHREAIARHEAVHARQGHTYDLLLFRLLRAVHWYNPLWNMALRELKLVHEHAADAEARSRCPGYEETLLASALGVPALPLAHAFRSSNLKARFAMMNRHPSPRRARLKYALALPALVLGIAFSAWSAVPLRMGPGPMPPDAYRNGPLAPDREPLFIGGRPALELYLHNNLRYPQAAREQGVEGVVLVAFVVDATGLVTGPTVIEGVSRALDEEALRVVGAMPAWEPALENGKPVSTRMVLPIAFGLPVKQPVFPGGMAALETYMLENVRYPREAAEKRAEGVVHVSFVIGKDGAVTDAEVVRSVDPLLDREALRVVNAMPRWQPGEKEGKPAPVRMVLPVAFRTGGGK